MWKVVIENLPKNSNLLAFLYVDYIGLSWENVCCNILRGVVWNSQPIWAFIIKKKKQNKVDVFFFVNRMTFKSLPAKSIWKRRKKYFDLSYDFLTPMGFPKEYSSRNITFTRFSSRSSFISYSTSIQHSQVKPMKKVNE